MDFRQIPFIVIWETTRACDLACVHCRAAAEPNPLPGELTHAEGIELIDQVAAMGTPVLVLSGGDPLKRSGLVDLIRHAKSRWLRVGTIPAATPRLTCEVVQELKEAGLDQMALSLDFSTAQAHDRFRGVAGAFAKVMEAVEWAHQAKLPAQINTVLSGENFDDVDNLIALVSRLGIVFWEVFFLVPVGRGVQVRSLTAQQVEELFAKLYRLGQGARFVIKVTEAPHYRRYVIQRKLEEMGLSAASTDRPLESLLAGPQRGRGPHSSIGLAPCGVNAGKGHLFVSSTGEMYPSGFLPLSAGNIRQTPLAELYRTSPLFRQLRQADLLKGQCGVCEYRDLCGGSRSRAFAVTGDYLAQEPSCAYEPRA